MGTGYYYSKHTGSEVDYGIDDIPKINQKLLTLESELKVTSESLQSETARAKQEEKKLDDKKLDKDEILSFENEINSKIEAQDEVIENFTEAIIDKVDNYKPIVINGGVTNAADEEDLTSDNGLLKFKNRSALNGLGYIILRKEKSFAEQVKLQNTIYEIRYDFDLEGQIVTLPDGCSIYFNGGSLRNGKLTGDNEVYFNKFCIDSSLDIKDLILSNNEFNLSDRRHGENIETYIEYISSLPYQVSITSNAKVDTITRETIIHSNTTLHDIRISLYSPTLDYSVCLLFEGDNINILNCSIDSNRERHGFIRLNNANNVLIKRCIFNKLANSNYSGYNIFCNTKANEIYIEDCEFYNTCWAVVYNDASSEQGDDFRTFKGVTYTGSIGYGLYVSGCKFRLHPIAHDVGFNGVGLNAPDFGFQNANYQNNVFEVFVENGSVWAEQIPFHMVNVTNGVFLNNSVCQLNENEYGSVSAIHLEYCHGCRVLSNYAKRCESAFHFGGCDNSIMANNISHFCQTAINLNSPNVANTKIKVLNNAVLGAYFTLLLGLIEDSEIMGNNLGGVEETFRGGKNVRFKNNRFSGINPYPFISISESFSGLVFESNIYNTKRLETFVVLESVARFCENDDVGIIGYERNPNGYFKNRKSFVVTKDREIFIPTSLKDGYYTRALFSYEQFPPQIETQEDGLFFYNRTARQLQIYDADKGAFVAYDGSNPTKFGALADIPTSRLVIGAQYFDISNNRPLWWDGEGWVNHNGLSIDEARIGVSNLRPANAKDGFQYFDTTINKPIWKIGGIWVDATGTQV